MYIAGDSVYTANVNTVNGQVRSGTITGSLKYSVQNTVYMLYVVVL